MWLLVGSVSAQKKCCLLPFCLDQNWIHWKLSLLPLLFACLKNNCLFLENVILFAHNYFVLSNKNKHSFEPFVLFQCWTWDSVIVWCLSYRDSVMFDVCICWFCWRVLKPSQNIKKKEYGCTEAFLADAKWILHNCIIFNGGECPCYVSIANLMIRHKFLQC